MCRSESWTAVWLLSRGVTYKLESSSSLVVSLTYDGRVVLMTSLQANASGLICIGFVVSLKIVRDCKAGVWKGSCFSVLHSLCAQHNDVVLHEERASMQAKVRSWKSYVSSLFFLPHMRSGQLQRKENTQGSICRRIMVQGGEAPRRRVMVKPSCVRLQRCDNLALRIAAKPPH